MNGDSGPGLRVGVARVLIGVLATVLMIGAVAWSVWESWQNVLSASRRTTAQIATMIASQADETPGRATAIAEDLR